MKPASGIYLWKKIFLKGTQIHTRHPLGYTEKFKISTLIGIGQSNVQPPTLLVMLVMLVGEKTLFFQAMHRVCYIQIFKVLNWGSLAVLMGKVGHPLNYY